MCLMRFKYWYSSCKNCPAPPMATMAGDSASIGASLEFSDALLRSYTKKSYGRPSLLVDLLTYETLKREASNAGKKASHSMSLAMRVVKMRTQDGKSRAS